MSTSERLRAAEQRLREVAAEATPGPWIARGDCVYTDAASEGRTWVAGDATMTEDADYIALMSPAVALAVADWVAEEAARCAEKERLGKPYFPSLAALALVDAILGAEDQP